LRLRETSAVYLFLPLVLSLLLAGLLAGCGGDSQSGDQSGGGQQGGNAGGEVAKKKAPTRLIITGTVRAYKDDIRRLSLRPASDVQGEKPIGFKVRKNAQITLSGKKADLGDIKAEQQAQISYVVKNEVNRAVVVRLFKPADKPAGDDGKKGNPPKGDDKSKESPEGGEKSG
jgi:hypothetical protein